MGIAARNVAAARIPSKNSRPENIFFREVNRPKSEAVTQGVRRYTIPASNAFGLPYPTGIQQSSGSLSGEAPDTPLKEMEVCNEIIDVYHRSECWRNFWCSHYVPVAGEPSV